MESSHLRVVPRTEEINLRWVDLDALNPPNVYIEVAIELTNVANMGSAAYPRMYLTRGIRTCNRNPSTRTYRIESTCYGLRTS